MIESLKNSSLKLELSNEGILLDMSRDVARIVLPQKLRYSEFQRLHCVSHPGTKPTTALIAERYVWTHMRSDIREWCRTCENCQRSKITRHTRSPLQTFPTYDRFRCLHIDLVGPLPIISGKQYLLTMIDIRTSWAKAMPCGDISSEYVIEIITKTWIRRFGVPEMQRSQRHN